MPPVNTYKQGAVGTTDRVADFQPESWSPTVFKALPYNQFPMTVVMDKMAMGGGTIDSRFHHWAEEAHTPYYGTVLDVYNDVLVNAYVSGGVEGDAVYVTVTAANAAQIIEGNDIVITNDANNSRRVIRVNRVVVADDTSSYFAGTLAQTDTGNVLAQTDLHWGLMSTAYEEGGELPTATSHDPQWYVNVTQIMKHAIEITGSEEREKERITGNKWTRDKQNAYIKMKTEEEWTYLLGRYKLGSGSNNKRKSSMRGVLQHIEDNDSANIIDWRASSGYSGTWLNSGLNWFETVVNDASTYSQHAVRTMYCGNGAWFGLNQAIRDSGQYYWETKQTTWGLSITTLIGLTSTLKIVMSPSFSTRGFNNSALICDMDCIRKKVFRPLKYVKSGDRDSMGGHVWTDGRKEGWYQEVTLEVVNTRAMRWLDGIGLDHN